MRESEWPYFDGRPEIALLTHCFTQKMAVNIPVNFHAVYEGQRKETGRYREAHSWRQQKQTCARVQISNRHLRCC